MGIMGQVLSSIIRCICCVTEKDDHNWPSPNTSPPNTPFRYKSLTGPSPMKSPSSACFESFTESYPSGSVHKELIVSDQHKKDSDIISRFLEKKTVIPRRCWGLHSDSNNTTIASALQQEALVSSPSLNSLSDHNTSPANTSLFNKSCSKDSIPSGISYLHHDAFKTDAFSPDRYIFPQCSNMGESIGKSSPTVALPPKTSLGSLTDPSLSDPIEMVRSPSTASFESFPESDLSSSVHEEIEVTPFQPEVESVRPRWMKQYSSLQKILLVGEGDFSFSACLAVAFGSATNMIATSLNSADFLRKNYGKAESNIQKLTSRGCTVAHGVDATKMASHLMFKGLKFDRIVFNFPHAGFFPEESPQSQRKRHQKLVKKFMANAKKMISEEEGEIHIRHKSNHFFRKWNLEDLGTMEGLRLIEELKFNIREFPGYNTKYGFGGDKNFNCYPSKTYIFGLYNC